MPDAARGLFVERSYRTTTVADIATATHVAVDTVYATVGRKPDLLLEMVESALSGTDHPVPARERDYVPAIRAATRPEDKIAIYAEAVATFQRLVPIFLALRDAAVGDAARVRLWTEISERRARNVREFAADLWATGQVRPDLSDNDVADVV